MSHLSLLFPASDPYYGAHARIHFCEHYKKNSLQNKECDTQNNVSLGELTQDNLKHGTVRRLTFNPYFDLTLDRLGKFLKSVED
jgi:hypothetical protein